MQLFDGSVDQGRVISRSTVVTSAHHLEVMDFEVWALTLRDFGVTSFCLGSEHEPSRCLENGLSSSSAVHSIVLSWFLLRQK